MLTGSGLLDQAQSWVGARVGGSALRRRRAPGDLVALLEAVRTGVSRGLLCAGGGGPPGELLHEELRQRSIGELHRRRPPGTGEVLIASAVAGLFTGVLADWVHGRIDACPAQPAGRV
jgi:hypothetical protein